VLKAHIDDSGSDDTCPHFVLGGLLAPAYTWGYVEHDWEQALEKWDLAYFKMSEAHSYEGQFCNWDEAARNACVCEFLEVVASRFPIAVAACVKKLDVREAVDEFRESLNWEPLERLGSFYPILMVRVIDLLLVGREAMHNAVGTKGKLRCIFDTQHSIGNAVSSMKPKLTAIAGVGGVTHVSSRDFVCLQAADMWAWSVRRVLARGKPTRIYKRFVGEHGWGVDVIGRETLDGLFADAHANRERDN
jgi:hypothetical protein